MRYLHGRMFLYLFLVALTASLEASVLLSLPTFDRDWNQVKKLKKKKKSQSKIHVEFNNHLVALQLQCKYSCLNFRLGRYWRRCTVASYYMVFCLQFNDFLEYNIFDLVPVCQIRLVPFDTFSNATSDIYVSLILFFCQ